MFSWRTEWRHRLLLRVSHRPQLPALPWRWSHPPWERYRKFTEPIDARELFRIESCKFLCEFVTVEICIIQWSRQDQFALWAVTGQECSRKSRKKCSQEKCSQCVAHRRFRVVAIFIRKAKIDVPLRLMRHTCYTWLTFDSLKIKIQL